MTDARTQVAAHLAPLLDAFHRVNEKVLRGVRQLVIDGSVERIVLDFDDLYLIIRANPDDDTVDLWIDVEVDTNSVNGGPLVTQLLASMVGKSFGWGWLTVNQQGYCDGVLLSFDGISPQVLLNVVASSIKESAIHLT